MMKIRNAILAAGLVTFAVSSMAQAGNNGRFTERTYEVTITNVTQGQFFTPVLVASHTNDIAFFKLGSTPSPELADLAEGGATGGLQAILDGLPALVMDTNTSTGGLIGPGQSVTVEISASRDFDRLSVAGMLLPTNDTFVAINSMPLPKRYGAQMAVAYDAGSEANDELCANIPGPQCMGLPFSDGLAEGFVHVSRGISGHGDLAPEDYDWRNPVARVSVRRVY